MRRASPISQLLRPAGWLVAGALVSRGAMLAASIVVTRTLSPERFGLLTLVQTVVALFSGLAGLGIGVAITRQVAQLRVTDPVAAATYLATSLWAAAGGSTCAFAAYLAAGNAISTHLLHEPAGKVIVASAGAVLFGGLVGVLQGALTGLEAFRATALSQCAQGCAVALGLVVGAREGGVNGALLGASAGYALAAFVSAGLLRVAARERAISLSRRFDRTSWRRLWSVALPAFVAFVVVYGALLYAQVVLSEQGASLAEVGLFNIAYRWHLAILFVPAAIAPVVLPMMTRLLSQRLRGAARQVFSMNLRMSLLLTVAPAAIFAVAAAPILGLSGAFYGDHPEVLMILALASIPTAVNNVLSGAALSLGAIRLWLLSDIALAAGLVGSATILAAEYGAEGLAISYLAAYVATDIVVGIGLRGRLRLV